MEKCQEASFFSVVFVGTNTSKGQKIKMRIKINKNDAIKALLQASSSFSCAFSHRRHHFQLCA
jgi:hypothetical protein